MAQVLQSTQLGFDGATRTRHAFRFEPGEYDRLREMVTVQTCEICERVQAITPDRRYRPDSGYRYSWERWYHADPWEEEETICDMVCDACDDTGRNDSDFSPYYCDACERYIAQRCLSNGWRGYFTVYQENLICVRCFQEGMMEHGITADDVEDGRLSCDFYNERDLRAAGFDEGRTFYDLDDRATILDYVAEVQANGHIVLFDQGRTAIGIGPDSVTAWTKLEDTDE